MKKLASAILLLLILFACSLQKRKYQGGYYFDRKKKPEYVITKKGQKNADAVGAKSRIAGQTITPLTPYPATDVPLLALQQKTPVFALLKKQSAPLPDSCDRIIFHNGNEIYAKVLEVTLNEVKYKKCDMPEGPLYVVYKSDIFMIKYLNGLKEVYTQNTENKNSVAKHNETQKPKYLNLVFVALGLSIYTYTFPIGLVLGIVALYKINRQPQKYKGKTFAISAIVVGALYILLFALTIGLHF